MKKYVGFNIDDDVLEKLKIISFIKGKTRTDLVNEGLELVIEKYSDSFEKFRQYAEKLDK